MTDDEARLARSVVKIFAAHVRHEADATHGPEAARWKQCGERLADFPTCRPVRLLAAALGLTPAMAIARVPHAELGVWCGVFLKHMPGPSDVVEPVTGEN